MKANINKKEIIKIYILVGITIFPIYLFQAHSLNNDLINSPNVIKLISYSVIAFYTICFLQIFFEKDKIENAIKNIKYVSISAIAPYVFFLNNSLTYLYTQPSNTSTTNKLLTVTLLIHIVNAVITILRSRNESERLKLIEYEFYLEDKIYMNRPYKKDYWKNEHSIGKKLTPIALSLLPFLYFLTEHHNEIDSKLAIVSIVSIPFSMYIFVILVKAYYIYIHIPTRLSTLESKPVIFKNTKKICRIKSKPPH